jgi:thiol-disulfide isomerase/thioredoxin
MKFFALLLTSMLFFTACEDQQQATDGDQFTEHTFNLQDTKGTTYVVKKIGPKVTVVGHEDKVVIFDIFATWCPGCKVIAPHLGNLQKKYPKDLLVLGITIERNIDNAKLDAFSKEHNANYPISNSEDNNILAQRLAYDMRQPRSFPIPLIIMYDTKGSYFRHYIGPAAEEIIDRDIRSARGKK